MPFTDWPDGKQHSISYAQHLANQRARQGNPLSLPDPPSGTYDRAIDYNAGATQRGYEQLRDDSQTRYEQGTEDYGLNLGDLTRGRDRTLADLLRGETRTNEDYTRQTADLGRQYGILGRQQAEGARRQGILSQGLVGESDRVRGENQGRDQGVLDTGRNRALEDIGTQRTRVGEDFGQGKTRLDLGYGREFGAFGGNQWTNPLTGGLMVGSLAQQLARGGVENAEYQSLASGQRADQAQQMGYVSPLTQNQQRGGTVAIGGTPVTPQMWQSGLFLDALLGRIR